MNKKQKKVLIRIIAASVTMILFAFIPVKGWLEFVLFMIPYFIIGYDILLKAFKGIKNKQVFDENFLMAVATVGAILLGEYPEGVAVMLFYQIGELFQSYAVGKSRRNISELMDIRPDYANIEVDGKLEQIDPDEVEVGTIIVVQPGEKIPIDGVIEEGNTTLNTSALTGESVPRDAREGDEVISGCINMSGLIKVKTTKEFGESTVSKILDLVENSSSKKSRSENFISKFAKYYTPAVCYGALALAILPPLVRMLFLSAAPEWSVWIYRALTFLVISCPCALVISIPLSFFAGIGGALLAMFQSSVQANTFTSTMTYEILLIVVIGGIGSITGSILGSFLYIASSEWWLRFLDDPVPYLGVNIPFMRGGFRMLVFSVVIMIVVLFFRKGIMGDREFSWDGIFNFFKKLCKKKDKSAKEVASK
jgi:Cd2+/Zn2+-exporting ATPase